MYASYYISLLAFAATVNARYVMYLTGQHYLVPKPELVSEITHVAIAFMQASSFNQVNPTSWPLFTTVDEVRSSFANGTAIMVAIGGWGDTAGFSKAAENKASRRLFAENVKAMVEFTGADGVDIDWEYPGGNGDDYKSVPNSDKAWEISAYPLLLAAIRSELGPTKIISAAVPGLPRDMLAFTPTTIPEISVSLDIFNIMTYDMMNRRDNITKHHTGVQLSLDAIDAYLDRGVAPEKMNLGFAFYVKWFKTDPNGGCDVDSVGCKTVLMEDPVTGGDLGQAGAFAWSDSVPSELEHSFKKALRDGNYDDIQGGHYYWDPEENIWWSWDTPQAILKKFPLIMEKKNLGGVFPWGLGEDSATWHHLEALTTGYTKYRDTRRAGKTKDWPPSKIIYKDEL